MRYIIARLLFFLIVCAFMWFVVAVFFLLGIAFIGDDTLAQVWSSSNLKYLYLLFASIVFGCPLGIVFGKSCWQGIIRKTGLISETTLQTIVHSDRFEKHS